MNSEEESMSLGLLRKKIKEEEKQHLGKELLDVLLYLVRLSDICGIDIGKATLRKVDPNAIKYPVSKTNLYNEGSQNH
ncbi:hypothetical protein AAG906_036903 [Vitis piasezkii]